MATETVTNWAKLLQVLNSRGPVSKELAKAALDELLAERQALIKEGKPLTEALTSRLKQFNRLQTMGKIPSTVLSEAESAAAAAARAAAEGTARGEAARAGLSATEAEAAAARQAAAAEAAAARTAASEAAAAEAAAAEAAAAEAAAAKAATTLAGRASAASNFLRNSPYGKANLAVGTLGAATDFLQNPQVERLPRIAIENLAGALGGTMGATAVGGLTSPTVVGAVPGAVVGGTAGYWAGRKIGEGLTDYLEYYGGKAGEYLGEKMYGKVPEYKPPTAQELEAYRARRQTAAQAATNAQTPAAGAAVAGTAAAGMAAPTAQAGAAEPAQAVQETPTAPVEAVPQPPAIEPLPVGLSQIETPYGTGEVGITSPEQGKRFAEMLAEDEPLVPISEGPETPDERFLRLMDLRRKNLKKQGLPYGDVPVYGSPATTPAGGAEEMMPSGAGEWIAAEKGNVSDKELEDRLTKNIYQNSVSERILFRRQNKGSSRGIQPQVTQEQARQQAQGIIAEMKRKAAAAGRMQQGLEGTLSQFTQ